VTADATDRPMAAGWECYQRSAFGDGCSSLRTVRGVISAVTVRGVRDEPPSTERATQQTSTDSNSGSSGDSEIRDARRSDGRPHSTEQCSYIETRRQYVTSVCYKRCQDTQT